MEVEKFKSIFEGLDIAYGQHQPNGSRADGKQQGKSYIVRQEVTNELWQKHLEGRVRLLALFLLGLIILLSGDALILIVILWTIVLYSRGSGN